MFVSSAIFNETSYYIDNKFFDDVRNMEGYNELVDPKEIKKFLQNLNFFKKDNSQGFPTIEEINEIRIKISIESFQEAKKNIIKKKWNKNERKLLIWVVYFFMKMYKKKLNEMVLNY